MRNSITYKRSKNKRKISEMTKLGGKQKTNTMDAVLQKQNKEKEKNYGSIRNEERGFESKGQIKG